MTKNEIVKFLRRVANGACFLSRQQIARAVGVRDPHSIDHVIHGLPRVAGRRYFVNDVAERLLENSTVKVDERDKNLG